MALSYSSGCRAALSAFLASTILSTSSIANQDGDSDASSKSDPGAIATLWEEADPQVDLVYRAAYFDDDLATFDGFASTLQTRVGLRTGKVANFQAYFQLRNVSIIGEEDFNSTLNGRSAFPVEPDPEATEIDQAYLSFTGLENVSVSVGRKKLNLGNQRFVSQVGWRQNHQSFDGLFIEAMPAENLKLSYSYAINVNRIFTDDSPVGNFDTSTHLANLEYTIPEVGKVTAYGYWLDMNDAFASALQTATLGGNLTGQRKVGDATFGYILEAARQVDISDNPFDIDLGYFRVEPKISYKGLSVRAGFEVLSGNGERGFQAPLSLLHAYNGFADRFLVTPADGLEDRYVEAAYQIQKGNPLAGLKAVVAYHDFSANETNTQYGTEWNVLVTKRLFAKVNGLLKLAVYDADQFSQDVTKFWFQLSTSF